MESHCCIALYSLDYYEGRVYFCIFVTHLHFLFCGIPIHISWPLLIGLSVLLLICSSPLYIFDTILSVTYVTWHFLLPVKYLLLTKALNYIVWSILSVFAYLVSIFCVLQKLFTKPSWQRWFPIFLLTSVWFFSLNLSLWLSAGNFCQWCEMGCKIHFFLYR